MEMSSLQITDNARINSDGPLIADAHRQVRTKKKSVNRRCCSFCKHTVPIESKKKKNKNKNKNKKMMMTEKKEEINRHHIWGYCPFCKRTDLTESKKKKKLKQRPILQIENTMDIIHEIRCRPPSQTLDDDIFDGYYYSKDDRHPGDGRHCCDPSPSPALSYPRRWSQQLATDDSVVSTTTTFSLMRIDHHQDDAESDYIIVFSADTEDGILLVSSSDAGKDYEEEACSWSVLSECDTVDSMDDDDLNDAVMEEEGVISYSKAVQLGISKAQNQQHEKAKVVVATTTTMTMTTTSTVTSRPPSTQTPCEVVVVAVVDLPNNQTRETSSSDKSSSSSFLRNNNNDDDGDNEDEDEDDGILLSIYDGAKSGHGGKASLRF